MTAAAATRPLSPADLDAAVEIDGAAAGRSRRGFFAKRLALLAEDPEAGLALGAERDGRLLGFAFARLVDGEFGGTTRAGVLDALAVSEAARGAGVGSALLASLTDALGARGARQLLTQADWSEHQLVGFFAASGFRLSGRFVLERGLERPAGEDFAWEDLPVRSMDERDAQAIVRLDRRITGRDRAAYYRRKIAETLRHAGVRVSLVAEVDGAFAGFLMARVDYGDFGRTEPTAVLDTVGVHPDFARRHVGRALVEQLVLNLGSLRVERILTEVGWDQLDLLAFFARTGFGPSQHLSFERPIGASPPSGGGARGARSSRIVV
ncbi:MAG TPA: GNAT family N-acetyltransferase [Anaeromyxobacteraceae bacterium]|nr:GNAT family N-acetyltransferase [Anaeromyxobacteraceae bacterium]